ncbi:hypothetical protein [Deinococcus radiophilus]|uniref:hypothetical protein n=1 Tax=Deinococcus radiophilus TaxID=32062 RepID=UPI00362339EC
MVYTPQGIRDREAQVAAEGETRFLVAAEDTRSGGLAAYSETYWGPERQALLYQGATAVRREARRQAWADWSKPRCCAGCRWQRQALDTSRPMWPMKMRL